MIDLFECRGAGGEWRFAEIMLSSAIAVSRLFLLLWTRDWAYQTVLLWLLDLKFIVAYNVLYGVMAHSSDSLKKTEFAE